MNGRTRTLAALSGAPLDRPPIWLMRQAGRFLPEYRVLRSSMSFLELVHSPEACTEAALQPLRRFPLDATIVFSDILVIPDALGLGLSFDAGHGPRFATCWTPDVALTWDGALDRMSFAYEAVRQLRAAAPDHAVYGFAGSPWTLFCYMVEGKGGGDFANARAMLRRHPEASLALLEQLADLVMGHLSRQLEAGADIVQVFDTWGGLLDRRTWLRFCAPGLRRIAKLQPSILFCRSGGHMKAELETLGYAGLGYDHTMELGPTSPLATQGNLDNALLLGPLDAIREEVDVIHRGLGGRKNHIYNLGHGVLPQTPPEAVAAFVDAVGRLR
jgi:uroporphyrinogen decarboxylase